MNSPFIANLGHPLWGSQSMQELAPGMRNGLPFLIRLVDDAPHRRWVTPPPPPWKEARSAPVDSQ